MESEMKFVKSKYNPEEAKIILNFAAYLIANLYLPEQITILTLYTGQLISIKDLLRKQFQHVTGVTLSTVDSYQGEENDIILLSLVRSNKNNSIGFLKVSNRVCVALSRARKGTSKSLY
jgi:superfamily I DNA and/or RNA helicase